MSLKRERSHHYGFTNIDYRTKQDKSALCLFQPWHNSKNFGTMGNSNYVSEYSLALSGMSEVASYSDCSFGGDFGGFSCGDCGGFSSIG